MATVAGLLLTACDTGPQPDFCRQGDCQYVYYDNADLRLHTTTDPNNEEVVDWLEVVGGASRVFVFTYVYRDAVNVSDDELTEYLRFEMPMASESFVLNSAETLAAANAYYERRCFCPAPLAYPVSGRIEGTRLDDKTFRITADITYDNGYSGAQAVTFEREFRLAVLE